MHYYQFNIGDYQSHTAHLTEMEDLAYRRLLDWAYLHESPIPLDPQEAARQVRMRPHSDCIADVLREFFVRTDDGWVSPRVQQEIEAVGIKKEKARASAKARWDANGMRSHSEGNAPITQDTVPSTHDPVSSGTNVPDCPADAEPAPEKPGKYPACDHNAVRSLYHACLPNLPACEVWNETRASMLRQRWREVAAELDKEGALVTKVALLEWWERFFDHVSRSKFLTGKAAAGKDRRPFLADLEWLIRPTNFAKIIENRYHGD
jgi:uncharacterized protein YdaU (DUF1376 family)